MYEWSLEQVYQETGLFQEPKREAFIEKLCSDRFKDSKNVQASFLKSKMIFHLQGTLKTKEFMKKDPLFLIFKKFITDSYERKE